MGAVDSLPCLCCRNKPATSQCVAAPVTGLKRRPARLAGALPPPAGRPIDTGSFTVARALAGLLLFTLLQLAWQGLQGSRVERVVLGAGVVGPAVWAVNTLTPQVHARAGERALLAPGGGLHIVNGCEGLEALFLLGSAVLVCPLGWRARLRGLLLGTGIVFLLNQARVLVLFYAWRHSPQRFDLLHGSVAPIAVVLAVCAFFAAWLHGEQRGLARRH